ncbi:MAG TPA: SRPBCC family protein [Usitatibacter sp.]
MKIIQWTLAVLGALVLLLVAGGFFIPSTFKVERSTVINAAPRKVYDLVVEPKQWTKWSVWNQRDPNMKITYKGPPFGMGAKWEWVSKTEGNGSMEFTRVEPDRVVEYALFFPDYNMRSAGAITLEPAGASTRVTWSNAGDVGGNPVKHYLTLTMDRMVGPDFAAGLANLKALAEQP